MTKLYICDEGIREGQVNALTAQLPKGWSLENNAKDAACIITGAAPVTAEMIKDAGSSLKCIINIKPGDPVIAETNVPVYVIYDTGVTAVAEHAMTLMLMLGRQMLTAWRKVKNQEWAEGKETPVHTDQKHYTYNWIGLPESGQLHGKQVGIVGFGFIGKDLAKRLNAFNAKVAYYDIVRMPKEIEEKYNAKYMPLDELLATSDFISLHLRYIEGEGGNEKMFNKDLFSKMKPTAYFINTSRGRMVDEAALADAVKNHVIAGCGIDVFEYEPVRPDCPLLPLIGDNVILTPHIAGTFMGEAWVQAAKEIIEDVNEAIAA